MDMPISQILLLFSVLLVGLIILAIGFFRGKRTVEVVGISLLIAVLIAFFVESQEVRDILVSFAIVVVAIISAANINELRNTRKEKSLNEIIEWAEAVANSAIGRQTKDPHELWKTKLEYKKHKTKGKLIGEMVSSSFKELSGSFKDINKRLDKAIEFTKQIENGKANVESLKDYETEIAGSVEKMFKKAAKIKTRDIS